MLRTRRGKYLLSSYNEYEFNPITEKLIDVEDEQQHKEFEFMLDEMKKGNPDFEIWSSQDKKQKSIEFSVEFNLVEHEQLQEKIAYYYFKYKGNLQSFGIFKRRDNDCTLPCDSGLLFDVIEQQNKTIYFKFLDFTYGTDTRETWNEFFWKNATTMI